MPIYEYECQKHGKFEVLQRGFTSEVCPKCGEMARKLVSSISIKSKSFRGTNQTELALQNVIRERQEYGSG